MFNRIKGFLFFAITFFCVFMPGSLVLLGARLFNRPYFPQTAAVAVNRILFGLFGIRIQVSGRENIHHGRACLVMSNHQSFLDIHLIMTQFRRLSFVAKAEIARWPFFGGAMERMHCIFVDRSDPASRKMVGPQMLKSIRRGVSYCVFPEGTRSTDGNLLPFKRGIFKIARECGLEILPVTISGSARVLSKRSFEMRSGLVRFAIHPSIDPMHFKSDEALMDAVKLSIQSGLIRGRSETQSGTRPHCRQCCGAPT